jgi:hypothetical protein
LDTLTQRSHLVPNYLVAAVDTDLTPGQNMIVGHTPDLRFVNMHNRDAEEVVTIGSDNWYIFPARAVLYTATDAAMFAILDAGADYTTGLMGYAYREIP